MGGTAYWDSKSRRHSKQSDVSEKGFPTRLHYHATILDGVEPDMLLRSFGLEQQLPEAAQYVIRDRSLGLFRVSRQMRCEQHTV